MATDLALSMLGGFSAARDGVPVSLPTRKACALLAYLALHSGRELRREQLAALLWGDRFDEQARRSLRQELYEIRNTLGENLASRLRTTRDVVVFDGDGLDVDVLRFEALVRRNDAESLEEAETLYRGPLLEGLEIGEIGFEDWLEAERSRLHEQVCAALERLARHRLDTGDAETSIKTARQLLKLDPLREEAHRLLMRGLAQAGRRSEALRHYQELETLLEADLEAEPEAETNELRDAIRLGAESPAVYASQASPAAAGSKRKPWKWVAAALVVIVAAVFGYLSLHTQQTPVEKAAIAKMAYPLPDKPSIAVLPFENFSADEQDGLIARGLTEDIITALSRLPQLFVISRTSSFAFKDKTLTATQIAEELGVRYILEGSIQRSGEHIRISAQLIDALEGHHLWADSFDGEATDLFALQDDLVRQILVELQVTLTDGDHARVASRGTTNLDAWLLRMQGMAELYKFSREGTVRTREIFQQAHEADPRWSRPLGGLAWTHWYEARRGWTDDREEWIRMGMEFAERAIKLDPKDTLGYMQLGNLYQLAGDHDRAIELREKAVEIAPNDFQANWGLGTALYRAGRIQEGVESIKRAQRLAPRHPVSLLWGLQEGQFLAGHFEDSIETGKHAIARKPDRDFPHILLVAAYGALGRDEDAQAEVAEVLKINPAFKVSTFRRSRNYKNEADLDSLSTLLLKAGLPN